MQDACAVADMLGTHASLSMHEALMHRLSIGGRWSEDMVYKVCVDNFYRPQQQYTKPGGLVETAVCLVGEYMPQL